MQTDPRNIAVPDGFVNMIPTDIRGLTFSRTPQMVRSRHPKPSCPVFGSSRMSLDMAAQGACHAAAQLHYDDICAVLRLRRTSTC